LGIRLDRNLRRTDGLEFLEPCQEVATQAEKNLLKQARRTQPSMTCFRRF